MYSTTTTIMSRKRTSRLSKNRFKNRSKNRSKKVKTRRGARRYRATSAPQTLKDFLEVIGVTQRYLLATVQDIKVEAIRDSIQEMSTKEEGLSQQDVESLIKKFKAAVVDFEKNGPKKAPQTFLRNLPR